MAASEAAEMTIREGNVPDFSLLISCVGRKLVLGDKTAEEVKAVSQTFHNKTVLGAFIFMVKYLPLIKAATASYTIKQ
nr:hypothetical protein [Runella sp. CRIBMP]